MNKQQEALKLALEALKELRMLGMNAQWHDSWLAKPNEAIAAIREALAEQPEPEKDWGAVADKHLAELKQSSKAITEEAAVNAVHKMAQARGLIDIGRIFTPEKEQPYPDNFIDALKYDVARRDSETAQQQEPFGHVTVRRLSQRFENHHDQYHFYPAGQPPYLDNVDECYAVYTSPPAQRKPLTDEEIVKITADPCLYICGGDYRIDIARAIEAAHGIKENT